MLDHFLRRKSSYLNEGFSSHQVQLLEASEVWNGSNREIAREREGGREGAAAFWSQLVGKAQNICLICFKGIAIVFLGFSIENTGFIKVSFVSS